MCIYMCVGPGGQVIPFPLFEVLDGKTPSDYVQRVEPSVSGVLSWLYPCGPEAPTRCPHTRARARARIHHRRRRHHNPLEPPPKKVRFAVTMHAYAL